MVITTNDITQKIYKKLSIQVALNGLSFCVFDLLTDKVIVTHSVTFAKNQVLEEQLWKVFVDYPILSNPYDEVVILHNNNLNTFVPSTLFDENFLGSYLQYNVKVFETDLFAYDTLDNFDIKNVYVPYVNINNFLLDQFSSFTYLNANTVLVNKLLSFSNFNEEKQVFVHVQPEHFEIVVLKNKELIFFNSFEYKTAEDFIYYLLFTLEQLQLNPDNVSVNCFGTIQKQDDNFKIAYKYIRNCDLLNVAALQKKRDRTEEDVRQNFILYQS